MTETAIKIFPNSWAEMNKEMFGKKYRPSNGTEGQIFIESFCSRCLLDIGRECEIVANTMCYGIDDEKYPVQWVYGKDGQPLCTEFTEMGDSFRNKS